MAEEDVEPQDEIEYVEPLADDLPRPAPNAALPIYEGPASVGDPPRTGKAAVQIVWTPEPALVCHVELDPVLENPRSLEELLRINHPIPIAVPGSSSMTGRLRGGNWHPDKPWMDLQIYGVETVHHGGDAAELRFELVNMERVHGVPIKYGDWSWGADRIHLESDRWQIDLDGVRGREVYEELNRSGGYAVTHAGRAVRANGSMINPEDVEDLFTTLQYTLSFAERRWVTPVRARGVAADGGLAWEVWGLWNATRWSRPLTWFGHGTPESLSSIFQAIDDQWTDPYWERLLRTSVHYYLDAARGLVHRGVIMGGALLELIGWHVVVEERGLLSGKGYDRLDADDRVRMLLRLMSLSLDVPSELPALKKYSKKSSWDLARAITEIRHSVVHARRHQKVWELDPEVWIDVSRLNDHLCDTAILFLLSYTGRYVDGLTARYAADAWPVPWASD